MTTYTDRIPVAPEYVRALGEVYYNFAVATWSLVYLMSLESKNYVWQAANQASATLARDFKVIAASSQNPAYIAFASQYATAVETRNGLLASVGITAVNGDQILDGAENNVDFQWTIERLNAFAKQLEDLDTQANALYYKNKPA